jgi:hypothetical protein
MTQTAFQVHRSWLIPAVLVLVGTGSADCVAVWFAQRPIPWAVGIAATLPMSLFFFVVVPVLRKAGTEGLGTRD